MSLNLLNNCDYKPIYSDQNKVNYKIVITSFSGDKDINNFIATNIKRNSKEGSDKIVEIVYNTDYKKSVMAKNSAGSITDYQIDVVTAFMVKKENNSENFLVNENFNFQKMADKYEEKNYKQNIKKKSCKFDITEANS